MEVYCTRPGCDRPRNPFADLDNPQTLVSVGQKFCARCGMPQILGGRYLPIRLLGQGGFGAAYLAIDRYTPGSRKCVVKQFLPPADFEGDRLQMAQGLFAKEAAVLEELGSQHPQIPDLYAFFPLTVPSPAGDRSQDYFYIVQEFIDGQNLEQELEKNGPFSEAATREVLKEVLGVLHFVHDRGAIHRDVKPSNLMRRRDGRLFLLDFGSVRFATGGAASKSTSIYSAGFAPPEQVTGGMVYPSTDLYALGVTCLVLLTGEAPDVLYDSYKGQWNWRSRVTVSNELAAVLDRMVQLTPDRRFGSAAEVLASLDNVTILPLINAPNGGARFQILTAPPPSTGSSVPIYPVPIQPAPPPTPSGLPSPIAPTSTKGAIAPFTTLEWITHALFTGVEGTLLWHFGQSLGRLFGLESAWLGLWLIVILLALQQSRTIDRFDLVILPAITLGVLAIVPILRDGMPLPYLILLAGAIGLGCVITTSLFRIVYLILKWLFR